MASKLEELRARAKASAALAYKAEGIEQNGQDTKVDSAGTVVVHSGIERTDVGSTGSTVNSSMASSNVQHGNTEVVAPATAATEVTLSPQQFSVVEKIAQVEALLLRNDPMMPMLLKQIHSALMKDPELVYLLHPEQIGVVVSGLMEVTKVVIVATAVKRVSTANGKKLSQLTLADL